MRSLPLQFTFADLELQFQGVQLDPILRAISMFLDQHLTLIEQVRKDLERGWKNARTGRNGIAPSQVLRSLVLMRVKNWDYRELQERINDGFTLRSFTEFDSHPVPKHDAFHRVSGVIRLKARWNASCLGTGWLSNSVKLRRVKPSLMRSCSSR